MTGILHGFGALMPLFGGVSALAGFFLLSFGNTLAITISSVFFFGFNQTLTALTTIESNVQSFIDRAYLVDKVSFYVEINTTVGGSTKITFRKNGADIGNTKVTVGAGLTGKFTKDANGSVSAQDLVDVAIDFQGGGTFNNYNYKAECFIT